MRTSASSPIGTFLHSMRDYERIAVERSLVVRYKHLSQLGAVQIVLANRLQDCKALVRKLEWDSNFFGLNIGKLEFFEFGPSASNVILVDTIVKEAKPHLDQQLAELGIDHLSVQVDTKDVVSLQVFQGLGFKIMDTIACYVLDLRPVPVSTKSGLPISDAVDLDIEKMKKIAGECFADISVNANRFNSDPFIPLDKTLEMYQAWATKSVSGELADATLVYKDAEDLKGFITISKPSKFDSDNGMKLFSIPLNAVDVRHHNKGVYQSLVSEAIKRAALMGAEWLEIRTQLSNQAVHRVWQKMGAKLVLSYHTCRLMKD